VTEKEEACAMLEKLAAGSNEASCEENQLASPALKTAASELAAGGRASYLQLLVK